MGYVMFRFRSADDVREYKDAGKKAKHGLSMVMDGLEKGDKEMAWEGAKKAWKGLSTMCDISEEMEEQFSERRNGTMENRGYDGRDEMMSRDWHDWNKRDDEMMNERLRRHMNRF